MKTNQTAWILRLIASAILLQTLYFKFTGAPESIYIFSTLGIEPYGRIGSGIAELIVAILILIPKTTWLGALGGCGVMTGAILSHLFILGIEVKNDGGLLFSLALITLVCCLILLYLNRNIIINLLKTK
ncbi:MAG: DoxX family protein [Flavobacterium sp.]